MWRMMAEPARPHELSGGEQQRVALSRASVLRPSVLLMDEPLSSLDDERKEMIIKDLLNLHQQLGFTLVYVTHNRREAERIASRILTMSGRLD
jgi:ABC-type sugar transport system ATPase subunit